MKNQRKKERDYKRKRTDYIVIEDRNQTREVHNGKGYVKRKRTNEIAVGRRWGDMVKTRKACTSGANKRLNRKGGKKK